jgi:hypothetical protein
MQDLAGPLQLSTKIRIMHNRSLKDILERD